MKLGMRFKLKKDKFSKKLCIKFMKVTGV